MIFWLQVYQQGKSSFSGPRMHLVMLALPFVIRGLIMPELNAICSRIGEDGVDDPSWDIEAPSDPVDEIFAALLDFFTWYISGLGYT